MHSSATERLCSHSNFAIPRSLHMLRINLGRSERYCDRVSRRSFLKLGSLSLGGMALGSLSLPQLLAAEAKAGIRSSTKAVINVHLSGGPSHQDIFDLKPNAPAEF